MVAVENLGVGTVAGLIAAGVFLVYHTFDISDDLDRPIEQREYSVNIVGHSADAPLFSLAYLPENGFCQWSRFASIVTPLGLYETIVPQDHGRDEPFSYVEDTSFMGVGTLSRRSDYGLLRYCWGYKPAVCPWSETRLEEISNSTNYQANLPEGYDVRLPKNITEIYSAGLSKLPSTISSVFDIQWRTYRKVLKDNSLQDNRPYLTGDYRHLTQLALNNAWDAVAGLIVNTKTVGIGFRNHTTPPGSPFGSTWTEDLLFIEPDTECVDMNITLDFNIALSNNAQDNVENVGITDHGGFANLDQEIPWYDTNKTWSRPNLRDRAYFAAWNGHNTRFEYWNSRVGAEFPVDGIGDLGAFSVSYDRLMLKNKFGDFLNMPTSLNTRHGTMYPNPFRITDSNFTLIPSACADVNERDYANMSNIAVTCEMVYGAARRRDGSASLLFDPGTQWTIPLYSCASASKASIKTTSFRYNGTSGLRSLDVVGIDAKPYSKEDDMPLWAVENWKMQLSYLNPVWGITLPEYANHPYISTARQEYLYLPGLANFDFASLASAQFLAGVDFYSKVMSFVYQQDGLGTAYPNGVPDYTGQSNLAMYNKWQDYSRNSTLIARIVNLIWTDLSANAVVGTRSQLPSEPLTNLVSKREELRTTVQVPVTIYRRKVHFHLRYGIPAFLALALCIICALAAFGLLVLGRATPSSMRRHLDHTSAGRILTKFLYPNECPPGMARENWLRLVGAKRIGLYPGLHPRAIDAGSGFHLGPGDSQSGTVTPSPTIGAYGKMDDTSISLQSLPSPQAYLPVSNNGAAATYYNSGLDPAHSSRYVQVPPGSGMLSPYGFDHADKR